jgi:Glycosyl transferases group 1
VYKELISKFNLSQNVVFWGKVPNQRVTEVYEHTDVLILPSIWPENQPVSITEAMAAGIPILASRIGGIPELVEDGMSGWLVAPGDASELALKIEFLEEKRALVAQAGLNAAEKMRGNSTADRVAAYLTLYHALKARPYPSVIARRSDAVLVWGEVIGVDLRKGLMLAEEAHPLGVHSILMYGEWMHPDFPIRNAIHIVSDERTYESCLRYILKYGGALVVPEELDCWTQLSAENAALCFNSPNELVLVLGYLFRNPMLIERLSSNISRRREQSSNLVCQEASA